MKATVLLLFVCLLALSACGVSNFASPISIPKRNTSAAHRHAHAGA